MSSTSETTRADPRTTRTHTLLMDAFYSLMREKHFEAITVQNITTRATVNRATFYDHFPDKYAMLDEMIRAGFASTLHGHIVTHTANIDWYLRCLFLAVTDHWTAVNAQCQHTYRLFGTLVEAQVKTQLRASVYEWLVQHPETCMQPQQRLDIAATIVSWSIYGAAMEWSTHAQDQAAEAFADAILPLIMASITALRAERCG